MLPLKNTCRRAELCPGSALKDGATWAHTERGHWWVLSHFLFLPLVLIKRLEEDQPCQNKVGKIGLFRTGQGCPNQGLLGLWGKCRFVEISEWVQMWVRPCCQKIAKVMQISPANQQLSGLAVVCEGCKYHFAEDIQRFLKFCFWGLAQKVFDIFAIFDWYTGMCFMASLRIIELQQHSCPVPCSKLACPSVPSINCIFTRFTEMWLSCFVWFVSVLHQDEQEKQQV